MAHSITSKAELLEFPLRCLVAGVVEELITRNFTQPTTELLEVIHILAR